MSSQREPPIVLEALRASSTASDNAAFIFLHGLGDEAAGVSNIGEQIQATGRLPHLRYIFPNALDNRDMMSTAWYLQTGLSVMPPSRPELADDEDEDGLLQSVHYIERLIEEQVETHGLSPNRIVVGGFSQGMAVSLLLGSLSETYNGRLAGIIGACGYLPLEDRIGDLRRERGINDRDIGQTQIYILRGKADRLVPSRYTTLAKNRLMEFGYRDGENGNLTIEEYEHVGHTINGAMIGDICSWLEKVLSTPES